MTVSSLTRILAIGTITGMRSLSGAAAMAAQHGRPLRHGTVWLAAGEMVADKTDIIGDRTDPLPLAGRAVIAAFLGGRIARAHHGSMWLGGALGAATAVASAHLARRLRTRYPDATVATGLIEDAIVLGAAALYARRSLPV